MLREIPCTVTSKPSPNAVWPGTCKNAVESQMTASRTSPTQAAPGRYLRRAEEKKHYCGCGFEQHRKAYYPAREPGVGFGVGDEPFFTHATQERIVDDLDEPDQTNHKKRSPGVDEEQKLHCLATRLARGPEAGRQPRGQRGRLPRLSVGRKSRRRITAAALQMPSDRVPDGNR